MNKAAILVIDDEPQIRRLLEITLESHDFIVRLADNGKEGIQLAAQHTPDLILLDIGLPDKSGHEVLKDLRVWFENAIIILSVQNSEQDIVNALEHGATDYLVKPFRSAELVARIRSAIRRNHAGTNKVTFKSGDLEIDFAGRTVTKNGQLIKLTNTEFNLLCLLARNEGRVLTHQYLLKEIWGVGAQMETQYLRVFVASLRKKTEDDPQQPKHILTESGIGYRFR